MAAAAAKQPTRKSTRGRRARTNKAYIGKVLRQVHPGVTISSRCMTIVNQMVTDLQDMLNNEIANLAKINGRRTASAQDCQASVRLILGGELAKHAISEGTKAVAKFEGKN